MHKLKYKSDDGLIDCTITVNSPIAKDKLEAAFKSLMLHLETSVGVYAHRNLFDQITKMRGEFYTQVLKCLVDENLSKGHSVPPHILSHVSQGSNLSNWSYDDD